MDGTPTSHGSTELVSLRQRVALLEVGIRRRGCMLGIIGGALLALGLVSAFGGVDARRQLASCRARLVESGQSHTALVHGDAGATADAPLVRAAWSTSFTITMHTARSAAYGSVNDGFTAAMTNGDPIRRIVGVDPGVIPYGSKVWIEGLGWYIAGDGGSAINGRKLAVMAHTHQQATQFGRQRRRVVVLAPGSGIDA
jgi:3D (Asp-Asp-Asp) domain-containing protein